MDKRLQRILSNKSIYSKVTTFPKCHMEWPGGELHFIHEIGKQPRLHDEIHSLFSGQPNDEAKDTVPTTRIPKAPEFKK